MQITIIATAATLAFASASPNLAAPTHRLATSIAATADEIPPSIFVAEKPKDSKGVKEVRSRAKAGDRVTVAGRVGGRKEPFVKSRAVFLIADPSLKICSENPGDACPTPWDYCCETPETLRANLATIQIVGADGKPLKTSAEKAGGLVPTARVVVVGTVREASDAGVLVIDAEAIHVEPPAKK